VLIVVKPDTLVRWHRASFRVFWRWKSRSRGTHEGDVSPAVKALIRQMAEANRWGAPKIHGELVKLGIVIGERSVSRFMPPRPRRPPSQPWRTFLDNHVGTLASIDFFTVPTATFRILYVFLVLAHDRRRVLHFNVTEHPGAAWTAQQIVEAFPEDTAPKYMIRDRDGLYGDEFRRRVEGIGIDEVLTAPRSPWQNPYAERLVGSGRRECLDHVIVLGDRHLYRILKSYFAYYHRARTHLSLGKDAPDTRGPSTRPAWARSWSCPKSAGRTPAFRCRPRSATVPIKDDLRLDASRMRTWRRTRALSPLGAAGLHPRPHRFLSS
jgi:transposase InsO family protein